jgi:hypothetical protein
MNLLNYISMILFMTQNQVLNHLTFVQVTVFIVATFNISKLSIIIRIVRISQETSEYVV